MTTKSAVLTVRIPAETKEELQAAAAYSGSSLSTLVLEAALARARRVLRKHERPGGLKPAKFSRSQALAYVRCLAHEARNGGSFRYLKVGYEAARFAPKLLEGREDRHKTLGDLRIALRSADNEAVFAWFAREVPFLGTLVPDWRRDTFAEGVRSSWAAGDATLKSQ